jgi:MFS family permease
MQTGWTTCLLTMSFILERAGGTDTEVGMFFSLQLFFYIITCVIIRTMGERLKSLRMARIGAGGSVLIAAGMVMVLSIELPDISIIKSHHLLVSAGALFGITMGLFWPATMAIISAGYEGQALSRRLGAYNVLVSLGLIVGPFMGGFLVERSSLFPIVASVMFFLFCFICLLLSLDKTSQLEIVPESTKHTVSPDAMPYNLKYMRIMAAVFLLSTFICGGLRVQMGLLLKFELGFSESLFGIIFVSGCIANMLMYYVLGKTQFWQGRLFMFYIGQILMLLSSIIILQCHFLVWFFFSSIGFGIAGAIAYSFHQFYSASVKKGRLGALAFHEIMQASGTIVGSMLSGFLSDHYNRYMPYWISVLVVGLSVFLQIILWISMKKYVKK